MKRDVASRNPRSGSGACAAAFTLVELLIVVAVVLLLVALLLPSLKGVEDRIAMVRCLHQMRQLGVGSSVFAADFGMFPTAGNQPCIAGALDWQRSWLGIEAIPTAMRGTVYADAGISGWLKDPAGVPREGVLAPYLGTTGKAGSPLYRCPSGPAATALRSGTGSNGMWDYTLFQSFQGARVVNVPVRATLVNPGTGQIEDWPTPLITEEDPRYGNNYDFIDPGHTSINRMGTWHGGYAANYAAVDGSAHTIRFGVALGPQANAWWVKDASGVNRQLGAVSICWGAWNSP